VTREEPEAQGENGQRYDRCHQCSGSEAVERLARDPHAHREVTHVNPPYTDIDRAAHPAQRAHRVLTGSLRRRLLQRITAL